MAIRFDVDRTKQPSFGNRRPVPNYSAPSVRLRLWLALGTLFLVVWLMQLAANPASWSWMWREGIGTHQGTTSVSATPINTRRPVAGPAPENPGESLPIQPAATPVGAPFPEFPRSDQSTDIEFHTELVSAWKYVIGRVDDSDAERLCAFLRRVRRGKPMSQGNDSEWQSSLEHISLAWQKLLDELRSANEESDDQPELTGTKLRLAARAKRLSDHWKEVSRDLLQTSDEPNKSLASKVQDLMNDHFRSSIRDDSVWRRAEKNIWFWYLDYLQNTSADTLKRESVGLVSFTQLFKQSPEYRGKVVTVRGRVRMGYFVKAPTNILEIPGYYVLWLRLEGAENSPVAVYSLNLPVGFPNLPNRTTDGSSIDLNEDVELTGIYFKRWAYEARDGVRLAPLVAANSFTWSSKTPVQTQPFDPFRLAAVVVAVAVVSISITVYVFQQTK